MKDENSGVSVLKLRFFFFSMLCAFSLGFISYWVSRLVNKYYLSESMGGVEHDSSFFIVILGS